MSFVLFLCFFFQMENVHLVPEEEDDDLYTGYNDYNPTFDSEVKKNTLHLLYVITTCFYA